jgi:L-amino acid N-acyltransferase YncA
MNVIRAATEEDADSIAHVHVMSWRSTYRGVVSDEYLAGLDEAARAVNWHDWLGMGVPVFVAVQDGLVVGFISGGPIREPIEDYDAELFTIYLLEQSQRRGVGSALLKRLAESLVESGFEKLVAWVLEDNQSYSFYERSGARRICSKEIDIGGTLLPVVAYGWPSIQAIASQG